VGGFLGGDWDYDHIRGETGPCVYPAGFIYIFSLLSIATHDGTQLRLAQYIFAGIYIVFMALLFVIYYKANQGSNKKVIPAVFVFMMLCLSRRIHSIFVLRLFNDCIAMLFLYMAIVAILYNMWSTGCILFSIAVSIKMNVLLFVPGLLVILVKTFGLWRTIPKLFLMLIVQLALGVPFFMENSTGYVGAAYNFGRKFFHVWTVNLKFLPEDIFKSATVAKLLLGLHLFVLIVFGIAKWTKYEGRFSYLLRLPLGQSENKKLTSQRMHFCHTANKL
jgi:alpha-1,3-mannosyltransferase